jgi:hypothetical protein
MDLAVLIIAYSRPEGVSYLLKLLKNLGVERVYLAVDGAKNQRDIVNWNKIELEISKYSSDFGGRLHVLKRDRNLGVAGGVLNAIDWFFSHEKMGVIIEDDLLISTDFFNFALGALIKHEADPRVWMVSGTQLNPDPSDVTNSIWTNYPMIWGWAGWAKKWTEMRGSLLRKKSIYIHNLMDRRYLFWAVSANRALAGKVDTWDTPLAFEFRYQDKLCLIPPVNLVSNMGNDEVSTHTKSESSTLNIEIQSLAYNFSLINSPNRIQLDRYNRYLEKNVFKIKIRHLLIPYYAFLFDNIRFPVSNRKPRLIDRNDWLEF